MEILLNVQQPPFLFVFLLPTSAYGSSTAEVSGADAEAAYKGFTFSSFLLLTAK